MIQTEEEPDQFREYSLPETDWQALSKAINEFAQAIHEALKPVVAAMQRILEAIAAAVLSIQAAWLLILQPDLGQAAAWRKVYAAYARDRLRLRAERWKRAGGLVKAVVDRLPDRAAIWLYREL